MMRAKEKLQTKDGSLLKSYGDYGATVTADDLQPLIHAERSITATRSSSTSHMLLCRFFYLKNGRQKNHARYFRGTNLGMVASCYKEASFMYPLCVMLMPIAWLQIALTGLFDRRTQDGYCLSHHLAGSLPDVPPTRWAYGIMLKRMKGAYPGGFKELLERYYNQKDHPIAMAWRELFSP
jgi:hypothetical protein